MIKSLQRAVERLGQLCPDEQQEAADMLADFATARHAEVYHFTAEEGRLVDQAIAEADRGDFATDAEVRAVFAKYRR